jgi:hypothetical protein
VNCASAVAEQLSYSTAVTVEALQRTVLLTGDVVECVHSSTHSLHDDAASAASCRSCNEMNLAAVLLRVCQQRWRQSDSVPAWFTLMLLLLPCAGVPLAC